MTLASPMLSFVISLQIRKVIFDLLWAQLPESWALCAFHTLVSEQVVCGGSNDTCDMSVSIYVT